MGEDQLEKLPWGAAQRRKIKVNAEMPGETERYGEKRTCTKRKGVYTMAGIVKGNSGWTKSFPLGSGDARESVSSIQNTADTTWCSCVRERLTHQEPSNRSDGTGDGKVSQKMVTDQT